MSMIVSYKRHRFSPEIITQAVWLYARLNLSLREVEEMLLKRGIDVSYETILRWVAKFAPRIAQNLRRRQAPPGDVWHLHEVVVTISGLKIWRWRAIDQEGIVCWSACGTFRSRYPNLYVRGDRCQFANGLDVAVQFVGDQDPREAEPADQPLQKPLCGLSVSACLYKNIENVGIGVDCSPQRMLRAAD